MKRALAERAKHTSFEKVTALEAPAVAVSSSSASSSPPHKVPRLEQTTTSHQEEPPPVDETSAFYLKHQNRALATELQSLRYAISSLEQERDTRRTQCRAAVRALLRLQLQNGNNFDLVAASGDPPSTGSGDSVEWTSALEKAVAGLKQSRLTNGDSSSPEQEGSSSAEDNAAALRAEVLELQNQISELATSRTELHQRERRVRRNVYRMSAGMLSKEQVLDSLEKDDEIEAAVRLEKSEQILSSTNARDRLKDEDAAVVDSALVAELETKIATLEATIRRSEESIRKVCTFIFNCFRVPSLIILLALYIVRPKAQCICYGKRPKDHGSRETPAFPGRRTKN
jgi:hypothetical protein